MLLLTVEGRSLGEEDQTVPIFTFTCVVDVERRILEGGNEVFVNGLGATLGKLLVLGFFTTERCISVESYIGD